ncbi:hypothetical protein ABMB68_005965 [Bradyrhizobium sp. RT4a]
MDRRRHLRDLNGPDEFGYHLRFQHGEIAATARLRPRLFCSKTRPTSSKVSSMIPASKEACGMMNGLHHGHAERQDHHDRNRRRLHNLDA